MEENNWKERIISKSKTYQIFSETNQKIEYFENISIDYLVNKFKELAKEVHDKACEEQKKICADVAMLKLYNEDKSGKEINIKYTDLDIDVSNFDGYVTVNYNSILNSPTVNFE